MGARWLVAALGASAVLAAPSHAAVSLTSVGTFDQPIFVTAPYGDAQRVFVVERPGVIRIIKDGTTLAAPFLDIHGLVSQSGEGGMLSMAFPFDYARTGRFYVHYTASRGGEQLRSQTVEYRRGSDPDRADPASARVVHQVDQPERNHNGGQIQFGPDGLLYIGFGDGGGGGDQHGQLGNAQDTAAGNDLGKVLRLDPQPSPGAAFTVPPNPLRGVAGRNDRIYAWGLRNPWRFSFDRDTGALAIGDVGQNAWEEIDYAPEGGGRGVNYGWRKYEGNHVYAADDREPANPSVTAPIHEYGHPSSGGAAITGGYVVRDRGVGELFGRYLYADSGAAGLRSLIPEAVGPISTDQPVPTSMDPAGVVSFGEDGIGRVYVAAWDLQRVYRVVGTPLPGVPPPFVGIVSGPADPTTEIGASIAWSASGAGVSTTCYLDGALQPCGASPFPASNLAPGGHTFVIRANDAGGSAVAMWSWRVVSASPFGVATSAPARVSVASFLRHGIRARCAATRDTTCRISVSISPRAAHRFGLFGGSLIASGAARVLAGAGPAVVTLRFDRRFLRALRRVSVTRRGIVLVVSAHAAAGGEVAEGLARVRVVRT